MGPPTHPVRAQSHVPGEGLTAPSPPHVVQATSQGREHGGLPGAVGQAGTGVAWLSLAAAVAAVETKEQVGGPSQPSHNKHLHCGGLGRGEPRWGEH